MKITLAIDPGGTTGLAIRLGPDEIWTGVAKTPEELYDMFTPALEQVVCENFGAENISKWGIYTVKLVGAVHGICHVKNIPCKIQMPTDRKPFSQDAKRMLSGKRHVIHEEDALAHLLRWEYDNRD